MRYFIHALICAVVFFGFESALLADSQVGDGSVAKKDTTDTSPMDPALAGAKYLDPNVPIQARVDDLFGRLTMEEKVSLLHGCGESDMGGIPRVGLRKIGTTDGPQGVRGPAATMFPSGIAMAASWDPTMVEQMGAALGEESLAAGSRMQLGPGMNIMRSPLGGRDFEYMGEDPLLTGNIAAGYVRGLQSRGVSACIKHFTGNEQEHWRTTMNVQIPERALREIYARPFEICIREGHPWALMAAYNKLNGDYCCHSRHLLIDLLRKDWNWDGEVVSDWGAWHDTTKAVNGGCDIEMEGWVNAKKDAKVLALIEKGAIFRDQFDSAVRSTLLLMFRVGAFGPAKPGSINTPAHQQIARKLAADSIVLLKNSNALLPIDANSIKTIAVIGPAADWKFTGNDLTVSGGSGAVFPPYEITALAGIRQKLGDRVKITYASGFTYERDRKLLVSHNDQISAAVDAARNADIAVVCVGTNHAYDRESLGWGTVPGADKPDLQLIGPASDLIKAVVAVNPKTVVVLTNGSPVSVEDWIDQVPALIEAWYPGMEGGNAIADVLFGDVNPSGKLPCTFGKKLTDWKCHSMTTEVFPGTGNNGIEKYDDGIWVGYRHFDHANIEPRFPFGFGLSYTTFQLRSPAIRHNPDGSFTAEVSITNTGNRDGAQVVQVYMAPPKSDVDRPDRELAGFAKISLIKAQTQVVSIPISRSSLAYWSDASPGWVITPGRYTFSIGTSSRDLPLGTSLDLK
jgi:beta-glucosidase